MTEQDGMDVEPRTMDQIMPVPPQIAHQLSTAMQQAFATPERQRFSLAGRFAIVLARYPMLGHAMDPFHLHLLHKAAPDVTLPATNTLDLDLLHALANSKTDPAYCRTLYYLEYKCKHGAWPLGFGSIAKGMRTWYRHLYKAIAAAAATSTSNVILHMERFPHVQAWTHLRPHPIELMAARLLVHVLTERRLDPMKLDVRWPNAVPLRVMQAVLLQCLRHDQGLVLFTQCLHVPLGNIEQHKSPVMSWLVNETGFFGNTSVMRDEIDQWLQVLQVPLDWIAPALLVQQRVDLLNDAQLTNVLDRFMQQNTSLCITPRPPWVDHERVRAAFGRLNKAARKPMIDAFLQNMDGMDAEARNTFVEFLSSIRELNLFVDAMLSRMFERELGFKEKKK